MDGIYLIDKPEGITSAEVVRRMKWTLKLDKVGHAGTLDPMATGLLIILSGKATKQQSFFLEGDKGYCGKILLGRTTRSDDITGEALSEAPIPVELTGDSAQTWVRSLEAKFRGPQQQVPPQVSAVKIDGQRSYKLARRNIAVDIQPRSVIFHELNLSFEAPDQLRYQMLCSKGTYVRSLARDIGAVLGIGACVSELRREQSGKVNVARSLPLEQVLEGDLRSYFPLESTGFTGLEL